ncbi:hypothetical protein Nepgr_008142 [Nepenthes gracilis]|uniref:Inorganic diphosphatase n=1 Tax=Nepenthes gracilis TaxID=150966 RepID=A0AAD3S903_NEPGR|nr:hypothetical protein Nepgr_008142 [Nepenthes gracilis]
MTLTESCHHKELLNDLPPHRLAEIRCFFEDDKRKENKGVAVDDYLPAEAAISAIKYSHVFDNLSFKFIGFMTLYHSLICQVILSTVPVSIPFIIMLKLSLCLIHASSLK